MPNIVAVQTDPIESLNYQSDTSVLLAEELGQRGFELFFYTPKDLYFAENRLAAAGHFIEIVGSEGKFYKSSAKTTIDFLKVSILMVRQNPPFNEDYLTNTYLLEHLPTSCFVFNNPKVLRDFPEKLSVLNFPGAIPKTIIAGDYNKLLEFYSKHKMVVIKPIHGFGGHDIAMIDTLKMFKDMVPEYLNRFGHCILQEYFPSIKAAGDKRVLIAGGKVLGAINRRPAAGSILSNLVAGGNAYATSLTPRELEISTQVARYLYKHGIFMAGIDLINEYLIEINVTSPTGFKSFNKVTGREIHKEVVDMIIERI